MFWFFDITKWTFKTKYWQVNTCIQGYLHSKVFGCFALSDEYLKWIWVTTKVRSSSGQGESSKWGHVKNNIVDKFSFYNKSYVFLTYIFFTHNKEETKSQYLKEIYSVEKNTLCLNNLKLYFWLRQLYLMLLLLVVQSTKQNCNLMHSLETSGCNSF